MYLIFVEKADLSSFALGVILIEKLMSIAGRLSLRKLFSSCASDANNGSRPDSNDSHGCNSRARFRILVLGGLLHSCFFVLMGTANGFASVLSAYFLASLGKAFLNGEGILSHSIP